MGWHGMAERNITLSGTLEKELSPSFTNWLLNETGNCLQ